MAHLWEDQAYSVLHVAGRVALLCCFYSIQVISNCIDPVVYRHSIWSGTEGLFRCCVFLNCYCSSSCRFLLYDQPCNAHNLGASTFFPGILLLLCSVFYMEQQ
ncbi:hypothetical protein BRADI_1g12852v3 [Brachypodium distachyon]|uniref:Uncharacterized protein n=1 Tax=Brachypodium distachyon TaxID=15368 RepID=A0A2K2DJ90_BRADI|nr:hypothetical protein BRADI_1g12852v3 [Brachypodium distachyon]